MRLCEFPLGEEAGRWKPCTACGYRYRGRSATMPQRPCDGTPRESLTVNDLSQGPCVHRGELVAVVGCELCGGKHKRIETFACLPDAGGAGPPLIVSEEQATYAQGLNRRRLVCVWCPRYEPGPAEGGEAGVSP